MTTDNGLYLFVIGALLIVIASLISFQPGG